MTDDPTHDGDQRFFFLHIQKTAGTALWQRLLQEFPREHLYPAPGDGDQPDVTIVVDQLEAAWRRRHHEIRIVTGHFPLCSIDLLGSHFRTFTVLRDPVERTLSSLRHYRELTPDMAEASLDEIYELPLQRLMIRNQMVKMLSLTVDEMTDGVLTHVTFTPERLQRAKDALDALDVVGLQEEFEPFCHELRRRYGWKLEGPKYANRTTPAAASDTLRRAIADDQADDMELYEFARNIAIR